MRLSNTIHTTPHRGSANRKAAPRFGCVEDVKSFGLFNVFAPVRTEYLAHMQGCSAGGRRTRVMPTILTALCREGWRPDLLPRIENALHIPTENKSGRCTNTKNIFGHISDAHMTAAPVVAPFSGTPRERLKYRPHRLQQ